MSTFLTIRPYAVLAVLAVGANATPAFAQLFQSAPQPTYTRDPSYPPGGYRADDPRLGTTGAIGDPDELDDPQGPRYSDRVSPPAPMNGLEDSRYSRSYGVPPPSYGPPPSYNTNGPPPSYGNAAPPVANQGPVMSPDDPRYGRLGEPPQVIYSDRPQGYPQGAPRDLTDRSYDDPYARGIRPPGGISAPGTVAAPAPQGGPGQQQSAPMQLSALPVEERPETGPAKLDPRFQRQEVNFVTKEPAGTIVVDTSNTYLYYVLGNGRAMRYGIRVGRDGFTWNGTQKITRKAEWPDWHPPSEMIERQPYLPRFMAGGEGNPLGARAMYLGNTVYRIHGTNQPSTIGKRVSSGCFGMLNDDVADLYERTKVGTRVVVMPGGPPAATASAQPATASAQPAAASAPYSPRADATPQQAYSVPGTQPTQVAPLPPPTNVR